MNKHPTFWNYLEEKSDMALKFTLDQIKNGRPVAIMPDSYTIPIEQNMCIQGGIYPKKCQL